MGVLLNDDKGWAVSGWATRSFFEDCITIIERKGGAFYHTLKSDLENAMLSYSYTLDYRDRTNEDIIPLLEIVTIYVSAYEDLYRNTIEEINTQNYKQSLLQLLEILRKNVGLSL